MVVLWSVAILSVIAIMTARGAATEMALTQYILSKERSRQMAWSGLIYSLKQLERDAKDEKMKDVDTKDWCGIVRQGNQTAESLFRNKMLEEGAFQIGYLPAARSDGTPVKMADGFEDEESRINLNAISKGNYQVVQNLLLLLGIDDESALTVALSLADWTDTDNMAANERYGAEDKYYTGRVPGYHCKNLPLDSLEELLLIRGMTGEIFRVVKPYVTIFPRSRELRVNLNTVSVIALTALARAYSGPQTNTGAGDADSLVGKIVAYRVREKQSGGAGGPLQEKDLPLNASEKAIFLAMGQNKTDRSDHFRFLIKGVDPLHEAVTKVEVVVERQRLSVVSWREK